VTVNADVLSAITGHHAELEAALRARVDAVLLAAREGRTTAEPVADLSGLLVGEIVPHARAEEEVLYAAAPPGLQPLVAGMVYEHETLFRLAGELSAASGSDAAATARAIAEIFVGHVRRENELLLPALSADPAVDLPALMPTMRARFAAYRRQAR
jgi:hypothetical protein